jgi:ubiquinone/menaquinone biosynthesis C-methylase UbiE
MEEKINASINYNAIAQSYATNRNASPTIMTHILAAMVDKPLLNILEIGCGTANHLYALSHAWDLIGSGFDSSPAMLEEAEKKNPGLNLKEGDASRNFPYLSNTFEFAFSIDVIHYIRDLHTYYLEAFRVLSPGGVLLTVTDSEEDIRSRLMSQYFPGIIPVELNRYHSIPLLEKAMLDAGFSQVQTTHTEFSYKLKDTHLEKFRNKAYSSLRLIPEDQFQSGLHQMEGDLQSKTIQGNELYTYVWGQK